MLLKYIYTFAAKMTTLAVKSDLDAAHALLDLQSDYREKQHGNGKQILYLIYFFYCI